VTNIDEYEYVRSLDVEEPFREMLRGALRDGRLFILVDDLMCAEHASQPEDAASLLTQEALACTLVVGARAVAAGIAVACRPRALSPALAAALRADAVPPLCPLELLPRMP